MELVKLRSIAVKALAQVYNSNQTLDESLFEEMTRKSGATLPDFDRGWLFEMCSGVLRYRGRIDYIIDTYSLKKKPTGALRRYLQTAVFQLLAQDVPSALPVSETVQALRQSEGEHPAKFANALLRKVADNREQWKSWKVTEKSPFDEQVAWCSLPEWLFKRLRKERGTPWVFAFSEACLNRPQTWYRELSKTEPTLLDGGYQGNEPKGYVQDISNQKLVEAVLAEMKARGMQKVKILDLCSAPGGKSLGLAAAGYNVISTDIDAERMQKVVENRSRLGFQSQIEVRDYNQVRDSSESYDVIWIDAPCSSTGIIRRHPEVKWNRTDKDVHRLMEYQKDLVLWAQSHLKPGGMIVYSTCSVLNEENQPKVEGLNVKKAFEWFPHEGQNGDAIVASILEKS